MPTTEQNTQVVNARRFAALFAGFDTGNASEEEAMSKGRALRRMAAERNLRIVDLLELPDVRKALDVQMQPVRQQGTELHAALEQVAALREELTERTRDVRKLVERLTKLRGRQGGVATKSASISDVSHSFGAQSWAFEIALVVLALVLLFGAAFN
jgi:hypothetical protein